MPLKLWRIKKTWDRRNDTARRFVFLIRVARNEVKLLLAVNERDWLAEYLAKPVFAARRPPISKKAKLTALQQREPHKRKLHVSPFPRSF